MAVIARRTSCRAYKTTPVPEADLYTVLEAARLAPSACNRQPWRFAVVREAATRQRIVEDGFLPGINMTWALRAPVLIVVGMETTFVTHRLGAAVSGVKYPWAISALRASTWYWQRPGAGWGRAGSGGFGHG